jgi:polysaccharide pyruvyl transferase WcaK-like protein
MARNKQFIILFCGTGPFSFPYKFQLFCISKFSKKIILRDENSKNYFSTKFHHKIQVLPDPAILASKIILSERLNLVFEKKIILINLIDYEKFDRKLSSTLDLQLLVSNLYQIKNIYKCELVLFLTSLSDKAFYLKVENVFYTEFDYKIRIFESNDLEEIQELMVTCKYAISNRMHAGIIPISFGIPTLIFPWQNKVIGFLSEMFGNNNEDFLVKDINLNASEISRKLEKLEMIDLVDIVKSRQSELLNICFD